MLGPELGLAYPLGLGECISSLQLCGTEQPTAPGRQHTPPPTPMAHAPGKPFRAAGRLVPAEGAACQSLQRAENPGNTALASLASTSLGGPKTGGGTLGTLLFISLFLNKSEVSGGADEVIRRDRSGIKPQASRLRRTLGTWTLEKLRWGLFILYSEHRTGAGVLGKHVPKPSAACSPGATGEFGCEQYF